MDSYVTMTHDIIDVRLLGQRYCIIIVLKIEDKYIIIFLEIHQADW